MRIDSDKKKVFYVVAYNIKNGGGKALLDSIIANLSNRWQCVIFVNDHYQFEQELPATHKVRRVRSKFLSRLFAEILIYVKSNKNDLIFYFGNLPPIFNLKGYVVTYLQNRLLIDHFDFPSFKFKVCLRIKLERLLFRIFYKKSNKIIVQTPTMRRLLNEKYPDIVNVEVAAFIDDYIPKKNRLNNVEKKYDFIYPASGDPHKNHCNLIEALIILAGEGCYPRVCLTIDEIQYPELHSWIIGNVKLHNLNIMNLGFLNKTQLTKAYSDSKALIYPSFCESFGMPIIEASYHGLFIVAAELDYVRDLVDPIETFNPLSATSISLAIKRFLIFSNNKLKVNSPIEFVDLIYHSGFANE